MSAAIFPTCYRVFETDFNEPRDDLTAFIRWWDEAPAEGESVLLVDGDHNVTKGMVVRVIRAPDKDARKDGLVSCESDYRSWLDGAAVLTLAVNYMEQQTHGDLLLRAKT